MHDTNQVGGAAMHVLFCGFVISVGYLTSYNLFAN